MKRIAGLLLGMLASQAGAQGTGLVNLMPPVTVPAAAASRAAAIASAGKPAQPAAGDKAMLNGPVALSLLHEDDGVQRVRVQISKVFARAEYPQALAAGRSVQRDVKLACGKLCKPGTMAAPSMLPDGKLAFDMVITGLDRSLSNTDMVAMLEGKPLARTVPPKPKAAASAPDAKP